MSIVYLPIIVGAIAFGIGFDAFFTLFHKILFVGDNTWLFDPRKDPVIWILPEEFFRHTFLLFFAFYEGFALLLYSWSKKSYLKKKGN
ncbi:TIGR01906-like family protein [Streptococcus constellatus subsp. pharyngis SK1060 = CCUG 46377]|uniref:TIGR01906-like family protein n=1 Tax=Streptococcus constellatus subsp. pharyngis SK1060 = CCUG 46377 TaxID=1035184 RepID=F9P6H1_STRCV|nr:TIGR01906-like family protein [Streptococcus constellatus subsp. pharyngis SK1060 = CCUG 46377]